MKILHIRESKNPIQDAKKIADHFRTAKTAFVSEYSSRRNELRQDLLLEVISHISSELFEAYSLLFSHKDNPNFMKLLNSSEHRTAQDTLEKLLKIVTKVMADVKKHQRPSDSDTAAIKIYFDELAKPIFNLLYEVDRALKKVA